MLNETASRWAGGHNRETAGARTCGLIPNCPDRLPLVGSAERTDPRSPGRSFPLSGPYREQVFRATRYETSQGAWGRAIQSPWATGSRPTAKRLRSMSLLTARPTRSPRKLGSGPDQPLVGVIPLPGHPEDAARVLHGLIRDNCGRPPMGCGRCRSGPSGTPSTNTSSWDPT